MKEIVDRQKAYFKTHSTRSIGFRIKQLKKLKHLLKENETRLHEAIYNDFKKSAFENQATELALIYQEIDQAVSKVRNWSRKKRVPTNLVNFPARSYIVPEPLGVSLVIGAWNYPYLLSLAPLVSAIAAGNTVVLKPSEMPAGTSKVMSDLINANFEPGFITVVEGGIPETTELLKQKFDNIFFTGSVPVGKIVYKAAAENLIPVTLELGGKSPAFITQSAQLKMTVKRLVWSKFLNAGQTCIAPDYVLVHKAVKDNFLELLKKEIVSSNYDFEHGNYTQIINERNFQRLTSLIDREKIYIGGNYNQENRFIQPTVLTDIGFDDRVMQDEIFGPILPVIEYDDLDEAIGWVTGLPKPLACYVFTSKNKTRDKILNDISFGAGCVNDAVMHISNPNLPYGGVGDSGLGSYHGEQGFKAFTHYKSILEKPTWFELNLKYFPHTKGKLALIKRIMRF